MGDMELIARAIGERIGETLSSQNRYTFFLSQSRGKRMPGLSMSGKGMWIFDPRLKSSHPRWVVMFPWEEMDEAVHHFLEIKRAL